MAGILLIVIPGLCLSCRSGRELVSSTLPDGKTIKVYSQKERAVGHKTVSRVRTYHFSHADVPAAFDGFRIAFISDLHYRSRLKEKGLADLPLLLDSLQPDVLLIGGDLHEGCTYLPPLMEALGQVRTVDGAYAVLGNNDYEACYPEIVAGLEKVGVRLLEHRVDSLRRGEDRIWLAGVRNPFDLQANGVSPTAGLPADDFVLLLTHTPDYAEEVAVENADLVLAGHTHGGQVTLFGLYAPVLPSRYGQRFRSGLKFTSNHTPVIVTNGVGTSRRNIRLFAPSEVVMVVLHHIR